MAAMTRKRPPRSAASAKQIEILAQFAQPLGYGMLKPIDGRSFDEALVDAWNALGVRSGDMVRLTLVRLTPEKGKTS